MFCFTYIIQLTIQMLLKHIIIKAENDKKKAMKFRCADKKTVII